LAITSDGNYLVFMSSRGGQTWSQEYVYYDGKPEYDGDIWMSKKDTNGKWTKPIVFSSISTSYGEDEPNISPDGKLLYFQSWQQGWERTGGPYYILMVDNQKFSAIGLGSEITNFFLDYQQNHGYIATDGCTISPNGKTLIVAVGEYTGNMDLFMSQKDEKNHWSYPKALKINTKQNERCPFLASDGKTLYFASNGYTSLGGLDIFRATLQDNGEFSEVINIGNPFNTKKDDYGFIITQNGEEIYLIQEGDIYFVDAKNKLTAIKPK
jgi:Tol biopolymer transport system component